MKADDDTIGMKLIASFPREDRALLEMLHNRKMLISDLREGYRQGWRGPALDDITIFAPWGFRIQDIRVRIDVWQGDADRNVPLHHGEFQAGEIPNARLRIEKGAGHLFLLVCWREVLQSLLE